MSNRSHKRKLRNRAIGRYIHRIMLRSSYNQKYLRLRRLLIMSIIVSISTRYGKYFVVDKLGTITTKRSLATQFINTAEAHTAYKKSISDYFASFVKLFPNWRNKSD